MVNVYALLVLVDCEAPASRSVFWISIVVIRTRAISVNLEVCCLRDIGIVGVIWLVIGVKK